MQVRLTDRFDGVRQDIDLIQSIAGLMTELNPFSPMGYVLIEKPAETCHQLIVTESNSEQKDSEKLALRLTKRIETLSTPSY